MARATVSGSSSSASKSAAAAQAAETKRENQRAANQKLLAEAQALLEKQKATLAALEKQKAEAAAAERARQTAAKLAEMKRVREEDLAAKSAVRREEAAAKKKAEDDARKNAQSQVPQSFGVAYTSSVSTTSYTPPPPDPVPATPPAQPPAVQAPVTPPVKTAPIDTVLLNDDQLEIEVMADLYFENISGQELINIARNDIVNGQTISYQPIKNLTSLQQQYNPNNMLSLQSTSDKYFSNFAIKLENKTPNVGNGPFGSNVYIDPLTGNMIVDTVNLESDEQVEVEITLSGTIYEADLTGSEL